VVVVVEEPAVEVVFAQRRLNRRKNHAYYLSFRGCGASCVNR
jgi:hypothetical protein